MAAPAPTPIDEATLQLIDPLDTLDEEDLAAMRDTMKLSRRNLAKGSNSVNALDYTVTDVFDVYHQPFTKGLMQNLFLGASAGFEQILPQTSVNKAVNVMQVYGLIGTKLDKLNSLRLGLGAGLGYQSDLGKRITRVGGKLDYFHSITSHFEGYNPQRTLDLSAMVGTGATINKGTGHKIAAELHAGLQFKIFTGPHGYINIEPYAGIGSKMMDRAYEKNWRGFDVFYGLNGVYEYSINDNMSRAGRMRLLLKRLNYYPEESLETSDLWRKPYFVDVSAGLALGNPANLTQTISELGFAGSIGHTTTLGVGKWISPVMGFRFSAFTRTSKRFDDEGVHQEASDNTPTALRYNSHYMGGRLEALFNPFGFFKSFQWDAPFGAYLSVGASLGTLTHYQSNYANKIRVYSEAYTFAVRGFGRISNDMQAFIEPRYELNVYGYDKKLHPMNTFSLSAGIAMYLRSKDYRLREEMDNVQDYTYSKSKYFNAGIGGGAVLLSRRYRDYAGGPFEWNVQAWGEYVLTYLHSVRFGADMMATSHYELGCQEPIGRKTLFGAINYQLNVSNLFSGRLTTRKFNFKVYAGPAVMYTLNSTLDKSVRDQLGEKSAYFGVNGGVHLDYPIGKKGFSVYFNPQVYFIGIGGGNQGFDLMGMNTVSISKTIHLYQSINVGVQYKIGSFRRSIERVKTIHMKHDAKWNSRAIKIAAKARERYEKKVARNHKQSTKVSTVKTKKKERY